MMTNGMYSSDTPEWETPQDLFDHYDSLFDFQLDVCATIDNAKCPLFMDKVMDSLKQEWSKRNWMNPPYGREIGKWVKKAYEESIDGRLIKGKLTVCLLPSRTDTRWWHDYVMKADAIHFIKGRLKFAGGGNKNSAPFPSAIVIFGLYREY